MGHDLFWHALLRLGRLYLGLLLDGAWGWGRSASCQTTSTPARPIKTRSKDPKPFPGLPHKPHGATWAHGQQPAPPVPPCPPSLLAASCGRRREVDTQQHYCPNPHCADGGWVGRGNSRANGHPGGGPWRPLQCTACRRYLQETHGTPLPGNRVPPEPCVWAVGALAEGMGLRAVARVFEVAPTTVLAWLIEGADQAAALSRHFLHDVHVTQVQLDKRLAVLSAVTAGEVSETEAIQRLARSPYWGWGAIDPVTKLVLTLDVGERTLAMAQCVAHQVMQI
jgi:hypothetical protein